MNFRTVPREKLEEREFTWNVAPKCTKYSPANGYNFMNKSTIKNVNFGEKTELINKLKLDKVRDKLTTRTLCTKGIHSCMGSIKRIKSLSKQYIDETYKKPVLVSEQRRHKARNIARAGDTTDDPTNDGERTPKLKSKFYVDTF